MKRLAAVSLASMALVWVQSTNGQQLEYDHFDFEFSSLSIDFDTHELTADGYGIAYTKKYSDSFMLLAGFRRFLFDEYDQFRLRQDTYNLGIGLHLPLSETSDFYARALYGGATSDLPSGTERDEGFAGAAGIRSFPFGKLGPPLSNIELDAALHYTAYTDPISLTGPQLSATGEARWYLNDLVSFGIGASYGEYETRWFGSFRIGFDLGD